MRAPCQGSRMRHCAHLSPSKHATAAAIPDPGARSTLPQGPHPAAAIGFEYSKLVRSVGQTPAGCKAGMKYASVPVPRLQQRPSAVTPLPQGGRLLAGAGGAIAREIARLGSRRRQHALWVRPHAGARSRRPQPRRWQATQWPSRPCFKAGVCVLHSGSSRIGQRVWK